MKIVIEIEPYDEAIDEDDSTGLTPAAYGELVKHLPGDVIDIRKEAD